VWIEMTNMLRLAWLLASLSFGTVWIEMFPVDDTGYNVESLSFGTVWIEMFFYHVLHAKS